jgi:NAD(P)-dependent dehydrogenase (short-subunit alcohol dehydrogenase family)
MSTKQCEGMVALVTGASKGGTGTAIAIRPFGGECVVLPADLSDPGGARTQLVARTEEALGPIDILVNNAAVNGYMPFETVTPRRLELSLQVNLWAPWELMCAVVPGMRARGSGAILNLTTFSAELPPGPPFPTNKPAKGGFLYGSAKAALNRLTVAAASECEGQGIAVNALAPQAAIATPALIALGEIDNAMYEPLETMAEAALALCVGDPNSLTGRIAFSLQLLLELQRPVLDLFGDELVAGWQPADLPAVIARQEANLVGRGWTDPYSFGRVHSPAP